MKIRTQYCLSAFLILATNALVAGPLDDALRELNGIYQDAARVDAIIRVYEDAFFKDRDLADVLTALPRGQEIQSNEIREALSTIRASTERILWNMREAFGRPGFRLYELDLGKCMLQATELYRLPELKALRDNIEQMLKQRQARIVRFIAAARERDPEFLDEELQGDLGALLEECNEKLAELKALRIRLNEETQTLKATQARLAHCQNELAAAIEERKCIAEECRSLRAQREAEEARLKTIFTDTLEATLKAARPQAQPDVITFFGFETQKALQDQLQDLLQIEIQIAMAEFQFQRPLNIELTFVNGSLFRSAEVMLWIHAEGMKAPLTKTFVLRDLRGVMAHYLREELPRIGKLLQFYAQTEAAVRQRAEEETRRQVAPQVPPAEQRPGWNDANAPANLEPAPTRRLPSLYPSLRTSAWDVD